MDELQSLRARCTRAINGHAQFTAAEQLANIPLDTELDLYGQGGVVAALEREVAELLGKPAALFLPSGTMAQQAVVRVHADRRKSRTVLFHPACHLDQHEGRAFERLHGLVGRPVGNPNRLLTLDDLGAVAEPTAVLLIELPQRDLGGRQPAWEELVAQVGWARDRGAAAHLDGARLWESAAGYGVEPARIAELFDTVYVSFYKGIGALSGCAVAGEPGVIAELAEWRGRHGGTLFALWPYAASALTCLHRRLPLMPRYLEHARAIAEALSGRPGVTVLPDPPQTSMMHLLLTGTTDSLQAAARRLAEEQLLWTWSATMPTGDPSVQRVELSVGDATSKLSPNEIGDAVAALIQPQPEIRPS
jgi:threonine aldolase